MYLSCMKRMCHNLDISVVIPTYNRANLLPKAVKSVLEQNHQSIEIIIVDDLSTDNTKEVIASFQNEKIKYVVNSRAKGANGARNTGVLMAKGKYIAFQDSDDIWLPTKIEKQLKYMEENTEVDMCFCSLNIDDFSRVVPNRKVESEEIHAQLKRGNFISTQTIFVKAEIAKEILFDEKLMRFQDWDFCLRLSEKYKVHHIDEVLAVAEVQNDSIGKQVNQAEALKQFFDKFPDLKDENLITKSFQHFVVSHRDKKNGNMFLSNIHYAKYFSYQFIDKVFNRRNRL